MVGREASETDDRLSTLTWASLDRNWCLGYTTLEDDLPIAIEGQRLSGFECSNWDGAGVPPVGLLSVGHCETRACHRGVSARDALYICTTNGLARALSLGDTASLRHQVQPVNINTSAVLTLFRRCVTPVTF